MRIFIVHIVLVMTVVKTLENDLVCIVLNASIFNLSDSLRNPVSMLINSFIRVLYECYMSFKAASEVQGQDANE